MTPTLRPYQLTAVDQIRSAYQQGHQSVLFVLPTGGGKTVLFSHITERTAAGGRRVCVLVHRAELLRQASASLTAAGVPHGVVAAGRSMDLSQPVQVASVQTLARRLRHFPPDWFNLLVVDEAHHSNAGTWATVLGHFHRSRVLGVTATPIRGDGQGLGQWYGAMVEGPTAAWLTEHGFLAPARVLAPPGIALQGLRRRMGDYDMKQAAEMLSSGQAMGSPLAHYRQHLDGQTAIAFCCSVAHADAVAQLFIDHGIPAASIDGTMDAATRERLLSDLGAGRLKVLTSCELIGEGVDVPSVAGCILLRPTQSLALHLQMIGRCLRPQPGKVAVVLDHVGNCHRHGLPTDDREWSLEGITKRSREAAPSVRVCPSCFAAMPTGTPQCPECGHQFVPERRELEHVEGELRELQRFRPGDIVTTKDESGFIDRPYRVIGSVALNGIESVTIEDIPSGYRSTVGPDEICLYLPTLRAEQSTAQTLSDLVAVGKRRGMSNPHAWARHVMAAREAKRGRSGPVRVVA